MNKPLATRHVMRESFARIGVPSDVSAALLEAAKHSKKRSPDAETVAQMFVSVADEQGLECLKIVVKHPFEYDVFKKDYSFWHGIKAAKAKKLLKKWAYS